MVRPPLKITEYLVNKLNTHQKPNGHFIHSLQFKGYLFILLLLSYIVFIAVFVLNQRHQPLEQQTQYQKIQKAQAALVQADLAAFHIVTVLFTDVSPADLNRVVEYFSGLRKYYINLQECFPEQASSFKNLLKTIPAALQQPSEETLKQIHIHLAQSKSELSRLTALNRLRLASLVEKARAQDDAIVVNTLTLGIIGLGMLGGITFLFFNHLKSDLNALQKRTAEIVQGYRGKPLSVKRQDEVGQLIHGVNNMASALAEREQALEIQRSKAAFMEKMDAIDSLAGGIAHEIGNPISSIAALAEDIKTDEDNQLSKDSQQNLASLLDYIDGLVKVIQALSVIDTHKSDEFEWLDIQQILSSTCNIFRYDKRWTNIKIQLHNNESLPAVFASVNQITQLVSNVLENAMDAVQGHHAPLIIIETQLQDKKHLLISIRDNGVGISKDALVNIFTPFYSSKPVGQGTGLGLAICWTIAKAHHGSITATSAKSKGTEINITLPINQPGNNE